jgi:hypothetical protein
MGSRNILHLSDLVIGGEGASETDILLPQSTWSIVKKSRHLGFGVFLDILVHVSEQFIPLPQRGAHYIFSGVAIFGGCEGVVEP